MTGKLISAEKGPERNVKLIISSKEVCSEISLPPGSYLPESIHHYLVSGMQAPPGSLVTLTFVLADQRRVQFYRTESKFDMALLLDQLDATIGMRRREVESVDVK